MTLHLAVIFITFCSIFLTYPKQTDALADPPNVPCYGNVPKISEEQFYFHDNNETNQVRFSTHINLLLELNYQGCFQVDFANTKNETVEVSSLFYAIKYEEYIQQYPIRSSYQFGIPELQSYCQCDCPQGDNFCTSKYDLQQCNKGTICLQRFFDHQSATGCQHEGSANLCCEVSVKPYEERRFTAVNLAHPINEAIISIQIFALHKNRWTLFRRYRRSVLPNRGNYLHLNGDENFADVYILVHANNAAYELEKSTGNYFYEEKSPFRLRMASNINDLLEYSSDKYGWLRFKDNDWSVIDPGVTLRFIHIPTVKNCREQTYQDHYNIKSETKVIRNASGMINALPDLGYDVLERDYLHLNSLHKSRTHSIEDMGAIIVSIKRAPTLQVDFALHQRMSIRAHLYASYMEGFVAKLCSDMYLNRYLNITLIQAYGQFLISIFKSDSIEDLNIDLVLSTVTELPFASNYTDILPLPTHVNAERYVCVSPVKNPRSRACQWTVFIKEPILWFELKTPFIPNKGNCPGCNVDTKSKSFWENLNPRNWFNGINSLSEGLALAVEIAVYIIVGSIAIFLIRKLIYPFLHWALCSGDTSGSKKRRDKYTTKTDAMV